MISTKNLSILLILSVIFLYEAQATTQVWSTVTGADGIAVDTLGNIFVSSTSGNVIYQLYEGFGTPVKFAGTGAAGHVDGNAFTEAQFNQPRGIAINDMGDIYVADYGNNAIRVISKGVVSTLVNNVPSPVDVSIVGTEGQYDSSYNYYYYYWYNSPNFVNPWGVYVTSESGTVYFVNEGPANDDCPFAIPVTLSSNPVVLHGTTVRAHGETFVPPCPVGTNTVPLNPAWYIFTGNGNQVNISTCGQSQTGYTQVFVYRDETPSSTQCSDLFCMGENYHSGACGTVTICTQQGMRYYVVVSSPYESYEGTFQLTITDMGASACSSCTCNGVQCGTDPCGGYCSNSTACARGQGCVDSQCVRQAANAFCSGSTPIVGNVTVSGNTQESFGSAPFIPGEGNCYYPQNSGLWYSFVGTGTYVSLTTCSPNTNYDTIVHVYENIYPEYQCDEFLCISTSDDFYCNGKSMYSKNDFCSQANTTYYYFVEGAGHGNFELTQTVSTTECTPGDYWPYWYYYYFSSTTFYWYDEE